MYQKLILHIQLNRTEYLIRRIETVEADECTIQLFYNKYIIVIIYFKNVKLFSNSS